MSNLALRNIEFNGEIEHPVYQRGSDGFFCLSQACLDLGKSVSSFLKSPAVGILFMRYGKKKAEKPRLKITSLVKNYPHLIYYDRSSKKIESGVWLHQVFLPIFEQWAQEVKGRNWHQHSLEIATFDRIYQVPTSHYQFWQSSLVKSTFDIWLRESDGFVRADSLGNIDSQAVGKLFKNKSFITNLEMLRERLDLKLDYSILNEQSISYSERIYKLYQPLYDQQIIEGTAVVWMDPELAKMFNNSWELEKASEDWKRRNSSSFPWQITLVGNEQESETAKGEISQFRIPGCNVSIYDAPKSIYFKITEAQSRWGFLLCPVKQKILISSRLLSKWELEKADNEQKVERSHKFDCFAQSELERAAKSDRIIERLLEAEDNISFKHCNIEQNSNLATLEFTSDGTKYIAIIPAEIAAAIGRTLKTVKDNIIYTGSLEHTRIQLAELGYQSPFLERVPEAKAETNIIASFDFRGHTISYRLDDGFVDANSLCKLGNKDLDKWLKSDHTWELFEERAKQLGKKSIYPKRGNSEYVRLARAFPYLLDRKRGSKTNGGGSWLDADLSIQLLAWIDVGFALELGQIFKERIQQKNQHLL